MKKIILNKNDIYQQLLRCVVVSCGIVTLSLNVNAQAPGYKAPQDTVKRKLKPNQSLTTFQTSTQAYKPDSRFIGAAVKAADMLKDSTKYDPKAGISIDQLFSKDDLEYVVRQGTNGVVVLFELVNKYLPKGETITFRTAQQATVTSGKNPLELSNLRASVAANPASLTGNQPQWKENVYRAYMARDYGTLLNNTITITSATREIRETPQLELIGPNGNITIGKILAQKQAQIKDKYQAEKAAVAEFRSYTIPGKVSQENANENYKRALFQLIDLQEGDINRHPATKTFVDQLTADLSKGTESNVVKALKNNNFYDSNVPGNVGPVLLTEDSVVNGAAIQKNPHDKALEITTLTALHYGERDAVKLLSSLMNGNGSVAAKQTNEFTPKRLGELTNHGTEQLKSLGFGTAKTNDMTTSDLVLVAVAAPYSPAIIRPDAFLTLSQVGSTIVSYYSNTETQEAKNFVMFNPTISLGSRHIEYRASFDAVDYVPELANGVSIGQKGSKVTQNGGELRLGSDLYFSNPEKIFASGVKPVIFPEFGILIGLGQRSVGYDNSTTLGAFGAVPQFNNIYLNYGGHIGINVGPFALSTDAMYLVSQTNDDPYKRFFDISQGMTYYRYTFLAHIFNLGLGKIEAGHGSHLTLDLEYSGETNNTGFNNHTLSNGSEAQIDNAEWRRDYARAHPGGVLNTAIANQMILNGDVKANYAAASYGAIHIGIQKAAFEYALTGGLYDLYTTSREHVFSGKLFSNLFSGNLFGAATITYHFGSRSYNSKYHKTETYNSVGGVESEHKVDESTTSQQADFGPRNHAIFTNSKSKMGPVYYDKN